MPKKDWMLFVLALLWLALATKVFFPKFWFYPMIAIWSSISTASMVIIITKRWKSSRIFFIGFIGGLTTILSTDFAFYWEGIPVFVGLCCALIFFIDIVDEGFGALTVPLTLVVNSIMLVSWASTSSLKWSLIGLHFCLLLMSWFLAPMAMDELTNPQQ